MSGLLPLLAWLSPGFPVGAFAYSHGLEWAVEAGDVRNEPSLRAWLEDLLRHGVGWNDAVLLAAAYRAVEQKSRAGLAEVNDLALALAASSEFRLETSQQGRSFLDAVLASWPSAALQRAVTPLGEVAYPIAVVIAAATRGIPLAEAVPAFLLAFVQNQVSAGVRSAPIGQTAGTRVVAALVPLIEELARDVLAASLDDLGSATFRADLGSFRHETQYSRLFRS